MQQGTIREIQETVAPATGDGGDRERLRKQQEVMNRVLANTVVGQLLQSGCDTGQMIEFATEILENVTALGFGKNGSAQGAGGDTAGADAIELSLELVGNGSRVPEVRGGRVSLRPLGKGDLAHLRRWTKEPHIQRTCSHRLLKERVRDGVGGEDARHAFVIHDADARPIGLVSLFHLRSDVRQAEIAKLVGEPDALGKGFAREATSLLLAYGFHRLDLQRVYLRTAGFNMHNIKLNEALGFQFEGILRASEILNNELIDVVLMSLLRSEFDRKYACRIREAEASASTG